MGERWDGFGPENVGNEGGKNVDTSRFQKTLFFVLIVEGKCRGADYIYFLTNKIGANKKINKGF
jgi:hypothetical protein